MNPAVARAGLHPRRFEKVEIILLQFPAKPGNLLGTDLALLPLLEASMKLRATSILAAAATAAVLGGSGVALAAPLLTLSIQARVQGSGNPFLNNVVVTPGAILDYQVIGQMSQSGTNTASGVKIITTPGANDGLQSAKFDLFQTDNDVDAVFTTAGTLNASFVPGTGSSGGTASGGDLGSIRPVATPGAFVGGQSPFSVITGTFTVGNTIAGDSLANVLGRWTTAGSGSLKINNATIVFITGTTETSADPYIVFTPLSLSAPPPPPAVVADIEDNDPGAGYTSLGNVAVSGSNGSYIPVNVNAGGAVKGKVGFTGIDTPVGEDVYVVLDVQDATEVAALVTALNSIAAGNNPVFSVSTSDPVIAQMTAAFGNSYDVLLRYVNRAGAGQDFFLYDFSNIAGANGGQVEIANIVLVPEPASFGLLAIGAMGLLGRRRRTA